MHFLLVSSSHDSDPNVMMIAVAVGFGAAMFLWLYAIIQKTFFDRSLHARLRRFLGEGLMKAAQFHEKTYPGYDLGSINHALNSFFADRCASHEAIGAAAFAELRDLLNAERNTYQRKQKPSTPGYTRVAVDVDEEESFISSCLFGCVLKPATDLPADQEGEKVLIYLQSISAHANVEEDMGEQAAPLTNIKLTLACRSKEIANQCFAELEERRKRLSIYRGKVVDPVISAGGIRSIAFKRIHRVAADDLILLPEVHGLITAAVIDFYRHKEVLRSIGVDMKRGILFHSPPGTGKTSISLYLAGLLPEFTVCFVSGRRLLYPREICSMARYLQPSMVVFEDIDLIAQERDRNGLATVLGELMNQIDGCEPNDQVLFVMNTNSMDRLEQAVRDRPGRVDQIIHIPLPNKDSRIRILRRFTTQLQMSDEAIEQLAEASNGATPAALKEVVKRAAVLAIASGSASPDPEKQIQVTSADLMLAYAQVQSMREQPQESAEIL